MPSQTVLRYRREKHEQVLPGVYVKKTDILQIVCWDMSENTQKSLDAISWDLCCWIVFTKYFFNVRYFPEVISGQTTLESVFLLFIGDNTNNIQQCYWNRRSQINLEDFHKIKCVSVKTLAWLVAGQPLFNSWYGFVALAFWQYMISGISCPAYDFWYIFFWIFFLHLITGF